MMRLPLGSLLLLLILGIAPVLQAQGPCVNTVRVVITFDNNPTETTWEVINQNTGALLAAGGGDFGQTTLDTTICADSNACYYFRIHDANGDGICCGNGNGSFDIYYNGTLVSSGGTFTDTAIVTNVGVGCLSFFKPSVVQADSVSPEDAVRNMLLGDCIEVSNITYSGPVNGIGVFRKGHSMGMDSGLILASGPISTAVGPNITTGAGQDMFEPGDPILDATFSTTTNDAAILEFDFVAQGQSAVFTYVFASEEYPEYVCSQFNDAFGFFVTGPGYAPNTNVALIPGTATPVAINAVNPGVAGFAGQAGNCTSLAYGSLYVDNTSGLYSEYDGYTRPLQAIIQTQPCQTYHIRLSVADAVDGVLDSGVLLEGKSFVGNNLVEIEAFQPTDSGVYEGCNGAYIEFRLGAAQSTMTKIPVTFKGTATSGLDYAPLPDTIFIPAGQTLFTLPIDAIEDGLLEGLESLIVEYSDTCSCFDAVLDTLWIRDGENPVVRINAEPDTICFGGLTTLQATLAGTPALPIQYAWSSGHTSPIIEFQLAKDSMFYITVTDACQRNGVDSILLEPRNPAPTVDAGPDSLSICFGDSVQIGGNPAATGGLAPYRYTWHPPGGLSSHLIANPQALPLVSTDYVLAVTDANGCTSADIVRVVVTDRVLVDAGPDHRVCVDSFVEVGGMPTASMGTPPYSYSWRPLQAVTSTIASNPKANVLTKQQLIITVTDANGCVGYDTAIIHPYMPPTLDAGEEIRDCPGSIVNLGGNPAASGGVAPLTLSWLPSTGLSDPSIGNPALTLSSGVSPAYTLMVTDSVGCRVRDTVRIHVHPVPTAQFTSSSNKLAAFFTDASVGATSWNWDFGDHATSTAQHPQHNYLTPGKYNVCLTVVNQFGCPAVSCDTLEISTISSVHRVEANLSVWPNPFHDQINFEGVPAGTAIRLTNALGQLVYQATLAVDGILPVPHLAAGPYLLRIGHGEQRAVICMIKARH